MNTLPHRRHTLHIQIGADTPEDTVTALKDILFEFGVRGVRGDLLSAGWSHSYTIKHELDADMDGDTYRAQLEEWRRNYNGEKDT